MLRSTANPSFFIRLRQRIAETLSRLHLRCSRCSRQNHKLTHVNQVEEAIMPIKTDEKDGAKTHLDHTNILPVKFKDAFTQTNDLQTETNVYHEIPSIKFEESFEQNDQILKA